MRSLVCLVLLLIFSGCSGFGMKMKSLVSGKSVKELKSASAGPKMLKPKSFSENPNQPYRVPRQYRRMTQNQIEQESRINDSVGSLWVNEGQTGYLFSQNQVRREGDVLNVKLDGAPLRGLETKVSVIKKMLKRLERKPSRRIASASRVNGAQAAEKQEEEAPAAQPAPAANSRNKKESVLDVDVVPTRIVERMVDGNYRVKGAQPFMIGRREFKVLVAGIVRSEDFNDAGISSSRLLDPKFDIVSMRRAQ